MEIIITDFFWLDFALLLFVDFSYYTDREAFTATNKVVFLYHAGTYYITCPTWFNMLICCLKNVCKELSTNHEREDNYW